MKLIILITLLAVVAAEVVTINQAIPCYCTKLYLSVKRNDFWHEYVGSGSLLVSYNSTIINNTESLISSGVLLKTEAYLFTDITASTNLYNRGLNSVINNGEVYVEQDTDEMNQPSTQYYWCFCINMVNANSLQVEYSMSYVYNQNNKVSGNIIIIVLPCVLIITICGAYFIILNSMSIHGRKEHCNAVYECICYPCVRTYRCFSSCCNEYSEFREYKKSKGLIEGRPMNYSG
jgi:hypothetical protein